MKPGSRKGWAYALHCRPARRGPSLSNGGVLSRRTMQWPFLSPFHGPREAFRSSAAREKGVYLNALRLEERKGRGNYSP